MEVNLRWKMHDQLKILSYALLLFFVYACANRQEPQNIKVAGMEKKVEETREAIYNKEYLMGKFDPASHPDFVPVPQEMAEREGMFLRKETMKAFQKMTAAAAEEGIKFVIRSATRNFEYQKGIWERKWNGTTTLSDGVNLGKVDWTDQKKALKILEYSSMPSTSRHHWGTDLDINSFDNGWFDKGEGLKLYNWMLKNASTYGFCQPYTKIGPERPEGYYEEKWHWSYLPLAKEMIEDAKILITNDDITGFSGAETASEIDVKRKYILGINKQCL